METESGSVQENRYDSEGLRFELLENGNRTAFVYHNGELLHEEGGKEKQTGCHLGAGIDAFRRGQDTYYYHQDEQLSTAFITGMDGAAMNSYQYDAFGVDAEAEEQLPNRIRYTGQQYDELTGQYYLRARYYNPIVGRFMQEDTYQDDGLNLYAYCKNNPVVYYDPSGYSQEPECVEAGFGEDDGGNEGGRDTELFLPDEFYEKKLPRQVTPETKYLPKYDELGNVKQIKMYDDYGREIGWVDYTDHGYEDIGSPDYHTVPHWHERIYDAKNRDGMKINHRTDTNTPLGDK